MTPEPFEDTAPLLTVITPVFQGRKYIESCLRSVIEQKCDTLEHLIIDGGSTDGTVAIVEDYAHRYPHIRWISEKDTGQSNAMNKGVRMARGRFIGFLNTDDYYEPGVLNDVVVILKKLREPAFLAGNCRIWDNNGQFLRLNEPRHLDVANIILTWVFPCNPAAYFYHRSLHDKAGLYDEADHYSMDLEFILRALPKAQVKYIDRVLGNYRLLEETKTFQAMQEGRTKVLIKELFKTHYERLPWHSKMYVKLVSTKLGWKLLKIQYYWDRVWHYLSHPRAVLQFLHRPREKDRI
jgi:glycosyltransferase involved in cell wall biosynthesis